MIGRPASRLFASILLIAQLVSGPYTHAAVMAAPQGDCDPVAAAAHTDTDVMARRADCPDEQPPASTASHTEQHHCRTHAACSCPCAQTPALGVVRLVIFRPVRPAAIEGVLAAGTFDPPVFDFFRPPN
jgi:hypothetical protein